MHLNPILFPAPRCKYSPDHLMGELIWIPKYKTNPTPSTASHRASHSMDTFETARNSKFLPNRPKVSQKIHKSFSCKPYIFETKQKEGFNFSINSKDNLPNEDRDQDDKHSTRILNPIESFDLFDRLPNRSRSPEGKENMKSLANCYSSFINKEKDDTITVNTLFKIPDQSFLIHSPSKKSDSQSEDVSLAILESPVKTGPVFLEKKFTRSQFSNKASKASTATRDECSNIDSNPSSVSHSKKPSLKNWQGSDLTIVDEDFETNFDSESVEEFPVQSNVFSIPHTINDYKLKTNEKNNVSRRLMTEYSFQTHGDIQNTKRTDLTSLYKETKVQHRQGVIDFIPCLILKSGIPTNKLLIYFHGNGEDVYLSYDLLVHIRNSLNVNKII